MDQDDLLRDTLKTRLMAHAEDLAFNDFARDTQLSEAENRQLLREQMFRAATSIAKVFELHPTFPPLLLVVKLDLRQDDMMATVRENFLRPLIMKHQRDEAERAEHRDHKTGLGNPAAFSRARVTALEQRAWFIALDFDNFKLINDRLGHPAGDAALREFAMLLTQVLEKFGLGSRGFRTGGDEFMVIVSERNPRTIALRIIAELRQAMRARLDSDEPFQDAEGARFAVRRFRQCQLWFSAGIGQTPQRADQALLRAKRRAIRIPEQRKPGERNLSPTDR